MGEKENEKMFSCWNGSWRAGEFYELKNLIEQLNITCKIYPTLNKYQVIIMCLVLPTHHTCLSSLEEWNFTVL